MKTADDVVCFKMLVRDVAHANGLRASFMTKPVPGPSANASLLSHSVWRRKEGQAATANVMLDNTDPDKVLIVFGDPSLSRLARDREGEIYSNDTFRVTNWSLF